MNFTTPVPLKKSDRPMNYSSEMVLLGSCFAENMAEKFAYFKFNSEVNPFGIIFNPVSVEQLIRRVVHQLEYKDEDVFFHNERWHCFEVHSDLSNENKDDLLKNLNRILVDFKEKFSRISHCTITYGTSWVYKNKASGQIVANCHKVPQSQFQKELLSIETIQKSILDTVSLIQEINPDCHFIFTISPVRHIKDGFVENQRSKSHLITALQFLLSENCILHSEYFPSYEIMMDELRDYRFYADDLLHPNSTAVNYIWERFSENHISEENHILMQEIDSIQKSLLHRPFNPNSQSHQQFLNNLSLKIAKIQQQLPFVQFI